MSKEHRLLLVHYLLLFLVVFFFAATGAVAQVAPQILKVEPPSWWAGSSLNPVRLLVRGKNLEQARVQISGRGLRIVGAPRVNERGTYLFVDVAIAPGAAPGMRSPRPAICTRACSRFFPRTSSRTGFNELPAHQLGGSTFRICGEAWATAPVVAKKKTARNSNR